MGGKPTSSAVKTVTSLMREDTNRIVAHDPLVRLHAEIGHGDTAVHQMRVGCRRLRSDLRTFKPLLDSAWSEALDVELDWFAELLGKVRDLEVLRVRLPRTAADPLVPIDPEVAASMDRLLAIREAAAHDVLERAMTSERYTALVQQLARLMAGPHFRDEAYDAEPAVILRLVAKPWWRLVKTVQHLEQDSPDELWHRARVRAKRARYALQSITGARAAKLSRALSHVQDNLGEHQDAVTAAAVWSMLAVEDLGWGFTAGRLFERERAQVRATRAAFPALWKRTSRPKLTRWLP